MCRKGWTMQAGSLVEFVLFCILCYGDTPKYRAVYHVMSYDVMYHVTQLTSA